MFLEFLDPRPTRRARATQEPVMPIGVTEARAEVAGQVRVVCAKRIVSDQEKTAAEPLTATRPRRGWSHTER